ncbi:uncharacterized, partial [Tachysurus ichikawai]
VCQQQPTKDRQVLFTTSEAVLKKSRHISTRDSASLAAAMDRQWRPISSAAVSTFTQQELERPKGVRADT